MTTTTDKPLYADLGNTRVKFLDGEEILFFYMSDDEIETIKEMTKGRKVYYSSVNYRFEDILGDICDETGSEFIDIKSELEKEKIVKYKHIEGIGPDRVLSLIGGTAFAEPPLITVESGTCNTVNILDKNFEVKGGCIFPGILTMFQSLSEVNPVLYAGVPEEGQYPKISIGTSTKDAVLSGVMSAMAGGVSYFIYKATETWDVSPLEIPIFISGGGGKYLYDNLGGQLAGREAVIEYKDNLVLYGIRKLIEG